MNVFGGFENMPKKLPDGTLRYTLGLDGVFQELARVVKRSGAVYIGEIIPPIGNVSWLADKDYSDYGLEKTVYNGYDEVKSFMEKMGGYTAIIDYLREGHGFIPFFIKLTKK